MKRLSSTWAIGVMSIIPPVFEYYAPRSIDEVLRLLSAHRSEAKVLAGGQSLLPMLRLRLIEPRYLIDVGRISDLRHIRDDGRILAIGATATHSMIESSDIIQRKVSLLSEVASVIAGVQVRNMGTIGGNLAHADPAADYPAAILVLDAEMIAQGLDGIRSIRATDFFRDLYTTALQPDELLLGVRIPVPGANTASAYVRFPHPASGFAVVGCAAYVEVAGGRFERVRVAFTGIASRPFRDSPLEEALTGKPVDLEFIEDVAGRAVQRIELVGDGFASVDYRRHLARVFVKRALRVAVTRARSEESKSGG